MLTSTKTPTPQTCARAQRPPVPGRSPRTGEGRFLNNALRVFHNVAAHRRGNNAYSAITTRRGQCSEYPLQRDVPLRNIRCNVCTNKRCSASASRVCFCEFRCQVACGLAVKFFLLTKTHTSTRSSREHVNCSFAACYFFPVRLFGGHSTRSFRAANSCPKLRIGRIFPEGVLNFLPFVLAISAEKKEPAAKTRRATKTATGQPRQPEASQRENNPRDSAHRNHSNRRARQPARTSTDGNGNAKADDTHQPAGKPANRSQRKHTRRRAPTEDNDNRSEAADPAEAGRPGTSDARPRQTEDNGQRDPAHDRPGSPGKRNHTAKQQRQDTAHTAKHLPHEKRNTRPRQPPRPLSAIATERKGRRRPPKQAVCLDCFSSDQPAQFSAVAATSSAKPLAFVAYNESAAALQHPNSDNVAARMAAVPSHGRDKRAHLIAWARAHLQTPEKQNDFHSRSATEAACQHV